jgi:acetyl esterase/lipase
MLTLTGRRRFLFSHPGSCSSGPAYIEVAEFDPLHDDGLTYAELLGKAGIPAELHETKGTMHGFDAKVQAPTTQRMIQSRIDFMRKAFLSSGSPA